MTTPRTGLADQPGPDDAPYDTESELTGSPVRQADDDTGTDLAEVTAADTVDGVDEGVSDTAAGQPVRVRWISLDYLIIAIFVLCGYYVTAKMWQSPSGVTPWANSTDQAFFEWMLQHAVRVFTHGENPFFTTQLNFPAGVNLMSNTNLLGLAIPLAPLTAWLGPAPVFVLIIMMGLAGTAIAWYYVLSRYIVQQRFAAFVGAAFCGFAPGIITHANAHPNLVTQWIIPFIVWRALALRASKRPVVDGLILGVLITYQAFLNEELLFLTAFASAMFVLVYAALRPRVVRPAIGPMVTGLGTAGGLAVVLLAYPLWFQFKGPQHFSGLPDFLRGYPYRLPLDSFVKLPTLSIWGSPNAYASGTEQNSFLGWFMVIALVLIIAVLSFYRPAVRALAVVGVFFAWASLGDQVVYSDVNKTHPYSLWDHLSHLPLFDSVLPSRLAMVLVPIGGVLLAYAIADLCRVFDRGFARSRALPMITSTVAILAILACCVTVVPTAVTVYPRPRVPEFFSSGQWRSWVPAGDSVLSATPYDTTAFMRWDIAAKLDFNVPGGYFLGPAPLEDGESTPLGQFGPQYRNTMLVMGSIGSNTWQLPPDATGYKAQAITDLKYWKTAIIVLTSDQPYAAQSRSAIDTLLGFSGQQVGDVWLWDVRSITAGS